MILYLLCDNAVILVCLTVQDASLLHSVTFQAKRSLSLTSFAWCYAVHWLGQDNSV